MIVAVRFFETHCTSMVDQGHSGLYYQLLTVLASCGVTTFPVMYELVTSAFYRAVFAAMHDLNPEFVPEQIMADFETASVPLLLFGSIW